MGRREEREQAFNIVFSALFKPDEAMTDIIEAETEAGAYIPSDYSKKLLDTLSKNTQEIDSIIEQRTVRWKKERLSKVALSVLRLSLCEILYFDDIPESVSVNEAVELAKKYSLQEDAAFVNGLLGSFIRERQGETGGEAADAQVKADTETAEPKAEEAETADARP